MRRGVGAGAVLALLPALAGLAPAGAAEPPPPPPDGTIFEPERLPYGPEVPGKLTVPAGFTVTEYAAGLGNPRILAVGPDGTVYATRRQTGDVIALLDTDRDGDADRTVRVAHGLKRVNGITVHENVLYLATDKKILTAPLRGAGTIGRLRTIVDDLPDAGQHPNRTLAVGPDGYLYVTVGSTCNACDDTNPENATILRMPLDGKGRIIYAKGLRNTIGFGWVPGTRALYGMDHGSDWRGDDQPPEELNRIERGANYGWPWCFADKQVDPYIPNQPTPFTKSRFCAATKAPALTYQAHSAPLQMLFSTSASFPRDYRGDAFVAMRGSWNRSQPAGYKVVRVRFDGTTPVAVEDFLTGFLTADGTGVYGRPVGLAQLPDGSLLVGDDTMGTVYRVAATR
ncbi:sorbosone dehydrogenase family protein [Motilibacter sp. K478]|nr:PQQ-dependent sugar dehydrogenase [Motilibacter aurantiacus]NHC46030.1 sorbosone dehydrogenase family protein [Motilibacter aurantiacus]